VRISKGDSLVKKTPLEKEKGKRGQEVDSMRAKLEDPISNEAENEDTSAKK